MDTPERNKIGTPKSTAISRFEDSPVFNYINNLSPIQPVKSLQISQSFNSLGFPSIPSVFTSPHVKEFRFFKRLQSPDPCKSEKNSDSGSKLSATATEVAKDDLRISESVHSDVPHESVDPGSSLGETSFEPHNVQPELAMELSRTLKFDCCSIDSKPVASSSIVTDDTQNVSGSTTSLVPSIQDAPEKGSVEHEEQMQEMCQIERNRHETGNDWECLLSEAAELLVFDSPDKTNEALEGEVQKSTYPGSSFCTSHVSELPNETEDPSCHPKELDQTRESMTNASTSNNMVNHQSRKILIEARKDMPLSFKPISNLHRGMRRRCLVFDMTGAHKKNLNNASDTGSSNLSQSDGKIASIDVPVKLGNDTARCMLPGIGLHLNSLALTSKDHIILTDEMLATENQLMGAPSSDPSSAASFHSPSINPETTDSSLALISLEREKDPSENEIHVLEDISQASTQLISEELNPSSPKKKKRRLEQAGETEGCKHCHCKKSKCLKLYCECFAAGIYCVDSCSCQECFNKPIHEDTVLATRKQIESRNPLAFAPKVIRNSDSVAETGHEPNKTPASARHKRGCNCKKSNCLKKYCECFQGGVGCSDSCRCEGCKNAFGTKDVSAPEAEPEEEEQESETGEKSALDQHLQKAIVQNEEEQSPDSAIPMTPIQISRSKSFTQASFSLKRKPPRSCLSIGSSSLLHISERLGKPHFLQPHSKPQMQTGTEDEMPDILKGNSSPSSGIKASSPNSKRVSPPHCNLGSSPGRRSVRKLILKSIPSFPSLAHQ